MPELSNPRAGERFLSTRQVMELLDEKYPRSITRLVERGDLKPAHKVPGATGAYLFARADVNRLLRKRKEAADDQARRMSALANKAGAA